jgi:hypothetical protein
MSCCFFRGKQSRRVFEVKGDSMNVDSNIGKRGYGGEGSRKDANIGGVFILKVGRGRIMWWGSRWTSSTGSSIITRNSSLAVPRPHLTSTQTIGAIDSSSCSVR